MLQPQLKVITSSLCPPPDVSMATPNIDYFKK